MSTQDDPIARLQSAREQAPVVETEQALARLESALFGRREPERVLDRYPIIRQLGSGGGGVVYLARDPELDREVAIKVLREERTGPSRTKAHARLLREARVMASSPHPNVVGVYDVGTTSMHGDRESAYIVMEYVPGPSLDAWLDVRRTWQDVLRVFTAAGRGLAAAHAVGVVHRDFKPSNVIVTPAEGKSDERVRVLDFGLAVAVDEDATTPGPEDSLSDSFSASRLTEHGAILGTPFYMAPEQHVGLEADAAADQFAFCVALWEGLVGRRPYRSRELSELAEAKVCGPPALPRKVAVPRRIVEVVARGLAPRPESRWESMDALLEALARARQRRSQGVVVAAALAPLLGYGLVALPDSDRCAQAGEEIDEVWSERRARSVREAFAGTGLPSAEGLARDVLHQTDAYAASWVEAWRDACHSASEESSHSGLFDRRMACLERAKNRLGAAASVLEDADEAIVLRADSIVQMLPRLSACADAERLLADVEPPQDNESAADIAVIRAEDARARALLIAGRVEAGLELSTELVEQAETIGYCPLIAETLATKGIAQEDLGRFDEAIETLERAHTTATSCHHDEIAADVSIVLVGVHGDGKREIETALRWAETAEADIVRSGTEKWRFHLTLAVGAVHEAAGRYDAAQALHRKALEMAKTDRERAVANNNLGLAARGARNLEVARSALTEASELWARVHRGDHPLRASTFNNLGGVALLEGDPREAEALFRSAVEMRVRIFGEDHVAVAQARGNLGIALRQQKRFDDAREEYRRALAVLEPDGRGIEHALNGAALVETRSGNHEEALRLLDRVVVLYEMRAPADHPMLANPIQNRAEAQARVGMREEADRNFARAIALKTEVAGATSRRVALARLDYADALRDGGDEAAAVAMAERALAGLDQDAHPEVRDELVEWLEAVGQRYAAPGGP